MNDLTVTGNESNIAMVERLHGRIQTVQHAYRKIMVDGTDYGKIPGCGDKPALMKAGAEKLMLAFQIAPTFLETVVDLGNFHREVRVKCTLTSKNGEILGEGLGSCSTLESKYRYRNVSDYELTGEPIPKDSKEKKAEYRRQGFGMKKVDGVWEWVKFLDAAKQENPDPADQWNTVLKMAKKRALVDGALTVLGASDIFTQDIEEMSGIENQPTEKAQTEKPAEPKEEKKERTWKQALGELRDKGIKAGFKQAVDEFIYSKIQDKAILDLTEAEAETLYNELAAEAPNMKKGSK